MTEVEPQRNEEVDTAKDALPLELTMKHPLQYDWVLWYCRIDKNTSQLNSVKAWEECLTAVTTCSTVEDFWCFYNHVQLASGLQHGSDYYFFKKGIRPMWEDEHNIKGGRWLVTIERMRKDLLDHYWLEMLLAMVGEQFQGLGDQVCGAVVNIRAKGDKVSLWTRDASNEEANRKIGIILKGKLNVQEPITYECHEDSSRKRGSMVKPKMWV